jgi:hypothetical protein
MKVKVINLGGNITSSLNPKLREEATRDQMHDAKNDKQYKRSLTAFSLSLVEAHFQAADSFTVIESLYDITFIEFLSRLKSLKM